MRWVIAVLTFVIAIPLTGLLFGQFMPRSMIRWTRRHPNWGRELNGLLMVGIALVAAIIAFRLAS